jgi:ornithine cyclodeaminase/alanine dehydrogenase-like protein (mu-crystallin family)
MLLDGKAGKLLGLLADDDLNMIRTGAPSAVACRHLAPSGAKFVAVLGSGKQARGQLLAIHQVIPIERVRVYSPTPEHRSRFAGEMRARLGIPIEAVDHPKEAVEGADIIDLATSGGRAVIEPGWVQPGALVISIAAKQIPAEMVPRSHVVISTRQRFAEEKREPYASLAAEGRWSYEKMDELGKVILGQAPARETPGQTVICELPGMPLWDAAIARLAYEWALERGVGTAFEIS